MDNNIENDDYSVSYNEEIREFRICFDGLLYNARKLNNTRESEVAYILDRLDTLDSKKGRAYQKTIK